MDYVESQTLELKREVNDVHAFQKTACAFSNTHGGKFLIGIDNDGRTVGIAESDLDRMQQRLVQALRQLTPVPFYEIEVLDLESRKVIQVEIEPMMYGSMCSLQGIIYYRHGSVTERAEGATLQELLVKRKIIDFELTLSSVRFEAVDVEVLKEYLGMRSPTLPFDNNRIENYLMSMGVLNQMNGGRLNNAGVMFFYPTPAEFIPQFEVKMVRFKGTTPVQILDAAFISRPMLRLLAEAETFVTRNTKNTFRIEGMDRLEVPEYPASVVREAFVNAVAHRNYFDSNAVQVNIFDDRIEFLSPGALPEGLTLENLGSYSIQRNPMIYKLLRDVRKVEGLATGIPRIRETLRDGGYPEPSFEVLGGKFFRVTVWNRDFAGYEWLSQRQRTGLQFIEKSGSMTSEEYANLNSLARSTANEDIREMVEKGLLEKIGKTRGSRYVIKKK
jgi:ATP-dependent DNA helicase RecG